MENSPYYYRMPPRARDSFQKFCKTTLFLSTSSYIGIAIFLFLFVSKSIWNANKNVYKYGQLIFGLGNFLNRIHNTISFILLSLEIIIMMIGWRESVHIREQGIISLQLNNFGGIEIQVERWLLNVKNHLFSGFHVQLGWVVFSFSFFSKLLPYVVSRMVRVIAYHMSFLLKISFS